MEPEKIKITRGELREGIAKVLREREDFPAAELGFACTVCGQAVRYSLSFPDFPSLREALPEVHIYDCGCGMLFYEEPRDFDVESWAVAIRKTRAGG
jgi:hypothetical protein